MTPENTYYGQRLWLDGFGGWYDSPDEGAVPVATSDHNGLFTLTAHGRDKGWATSPDRLVLLTPEVTR